MTPSLADRLRVAGADAETTFSGSLDDAVMRCDGTAALYPDLVAPPRDPEAITVFEGTALADHAELCPQLITPRRDPDILVLEGE
jgi:hypothetical protein